MVVGVASEPAARPGVEAGAPSAKDPAAAGTPMESSAAVEGTVDDNGGKAGDRGTEDGGGNDVSIQRRILFGHIPVCPFVHLSITSVSSLFFIFSFSLGSAYVRPLPRPGPAETHRAPYRLSRHARSLNWIMAFIHSSTLRLHLDQCII